MIIYSCKSDHIINDWLYEQALYCQTGKYLDLTGLPDPWKILSVLSFVSHTIVGYSLSHLAKIFSL